MCKNRWARMCGVPQPIGLIILFMHNKVTDAEAAHQPKALNHRNRHY